MSVRASLIKLLVFAVFSATVLVIMWNTLSNSTTGDTTRVVAMFSDASGLKSGDSVRIAGVRVGRVDDVELVDNVAQVTLSVENAHPVRSNTRLLIRYENLLGRRYVSLRPGPGEPGEALDEGAVIPVEMTDPAFDITVLVNGFQPLFDLLGEDDINKLSDTIVKVLQGEGATVNDLLVQAGRVMTSVADHDQAIGDVITNLSAVLGQLESNDRQFVGLVRQLGTLVHGLSQQKGAITRTITSVNALTVHVDDLVDQARPVMRGVVVKARDVFSIYARERSLLDRLFKTLPDFFARPTRITQHGSWVNIYPCEIRTTLVGADLLGVAGHQHSEVCR